MESATKVAEHKTLFRLFDPSSAERLEALCPPETYESLPQESPVFSKNAVAAFETWQPFNLALKMSSMDSGEFAAFYGGRISPEHYQFAPLAPMLQLPRPSLLIADDVGLGKTVEAGIILLEMLARGHGKRILLVVPPDLIPKWQAEMLTKFGLKFEAIEKRGGPRTGTDPPVGGHQALGLLEPRHHLHRVSEKARGSGQRLCRSSSWISRKSFPTWLSRIVAALWRSPCAVISSTPRDLRAARSRKLNARFENGAPEYPAKINGDPAKTIPPGARMRRPLKFSWRAFHSRSAALKRPGTGTSWKTLPLPLIRRATISSPTLWQSDQLSWINSSNRQAV